MVPRIDIAAVLARAQAQALLASNGLPSVGDLVTPLAADGSQIPDNGVPFPWLITAIETGSDGQQYALFWESDTGWLLAQCQPVPRRDPTAIDEDA